MLSLHLQGRRVRDACLLMFVGVKLAHGQGKGWWRKGPIDKTLLSLLEKRAVAMCSVRRANGILF